MSCGPGIRQYFADATPCSGGWHSDLVGGRRLHVADGADHHDHGANEHHRDRTSAAHHFDDGTGTGTGTDASHPFP